MTDSKQHSVQELETLIELGIENRNYKPTYEDCRRADVALKSLIEQLEVVTDPFDTVAAAKDAGHEKAREWRRTPDVTAWETVREYIAHNATSKETPRAEALAALASLQAAYEAMEQELGARPEWVTCDYQPEKREGDSGGVSCTRALALDAARIEDLEAALAEEARLRIKDCEDRNAYKRRADIAEAALREIIEEFRSGSGGYDEDDPVVIIARRALKEGK